MALSNTLPRRSFRRALGRASFASRERAPWLFGFLVVAVLLLGLVGAVDPAVAGVPTGVSFSKSFNPPTIGPGSVSTLTFTITSLNPQPVTDLAFTDTLPAGLTIAAPAFLLNSCGGILDAPEGGTTITLSGGAVAAFGSCLVAVDVAGSTAGSFDNFSGDLTSSAGNSGPAAATLTVATNRPGFSKSFNPALVQLGETGRLTFTIDNTANPALVTNLSFTDILPAGLQIAGSPNLSNGCGGSVTAPAGGSSVSLVVGFVLASTDCAIGVDVTAMAVGRLDNRTSDLSSSAGTSGKASASLTVVADELALVKSFVDDPAFPGGTTTLEFSITNLNRSATATGIAFTDDLDATLSGLVAVAPLPTNPCGAGSTLSGTGLLSLTGGTLDSGETCTFQVTLQVPAAATPGSFPNTTSDVTGTVGGSMVTGSPATDTLVVDIFPVLTKSFVSSPAASGGTVDVEFTITNSSTSFGASNITFLDTLSAFLAGTTAMGLPMAACGGTLSQLINVPDTGDVSLLLASGSLGPGASCNFTVTLQIDPGAPGGTYTNTTGEITATVDGATRTGPPASDTLDVVAPPTLLKEFTDDPVDPGGTVTLEFTLTHDELAAGDATDIAFTDDLDATLTGLTAIGLPLTDICGTGSQLAGVPDASNLSFTGGVLAPGESCTFSVTLQVPMGAAAGFHTNTTSPVTATVSGLAATGNPASDDLLIGGVRLTKQFVGDPVIPGSPVILRFTITDDSPAFDATDIFFVDDLSAVIPGLAATGLPLSNICGTGSQLAGVPDASHLVFSGGSLSAGTFCTFDVTLQVPPGAASGSYLNVATAFTATIGGTTVVFDNAADDLMVDADPLQLTKEFTDDPVSPGDTVTLELTLTNLNATATITDIAFTDDLDATLSGLASESGTQTDVCGSGSQLDGTGVLSLTGGSLGPGGSCTFSATLRIPAVVSGSGTFPNTTGAPTGNVGAVPVGGSPGSDTLLVNLLAFSKSFDGPAGATGSAVLSFTIENLSSSVDASNLGFTDNLEAVIPGLVATDTPQSGICGFGSQITGTSLLVFSGASLGPSASCTFDVTVAVPAGASSGSFLNTTSALKAGGLTVAAPATDSLQIEPPPAFSKVFFPNAIAIGGISTLTFTVNNSASVLDADGLSFTDTLPAGLTVASTPAVSNTCGGSVTATSGAGAVSLTGGSVGAGASCTVQVDVTGSTEGTFVNTSGPLTSSLGSSGPATDTINVVAGDFVVLKSFRTDPVLRGGQVEMELSVVNGSAFPLTDIALTDDLDAALPGLAAEGLPLADVCGLGSQIAGTSVVSLTGGNLAPGGSCTVVVPVRVPVDAPLGTFANTTSLVTALREGVAVEADPASADLTVDFLDFTKAFSPTSVETRQTVQLTFHLTNPDPANGISDLTFTDELQAVFPGLVAVDTPQTDVCGTGSEISGDSLLVFTGGSLGPGGSCSFTVTLAVPSAPGGVVENVTSVLAGRVDDAPVAGDPADAAQAVLQIVGLLEIPTLSFWMMVLLAGLLAVAALRRLS